MRFSLRYQLLLPLLVLILGVGGISTWTGYSSAQRARQRIEQQMTDLANTAQAVTIPRNAQTLKLIKGMSGAELLLTDHHGQPLRDDRQLPLTTLEQLPPSLPPPLDSQAIGLGEHVRIGSQSYFLRAVPLGQDVHAGLVLYLFYPETLWNEALRQAITPALVLGSVGMVSLLLTVAFANRLTRRFAQMERRTRLIAAGDFSPMPVPSRNDELRDLAESINDMAQQLAHLQTTVRMTERLRLLGQVSGGLAHQLRNGIAGAKLALQIHARECPLQPPAEELEVSLRQLVLAEMHLKRFLDLGRAEEIPKCPVELIQLVEETLALVRPQSKHAHLQLVWDPPQAPLWVKGNSDALGQMLLNLLANAMEAAGAQGRVEVRLTSQPEFIELGVLDTGPGLSPEIADRLFEPFVTGKPEGVGLGLAVARQTAVGHGGTLNWSRHDGLTHFQVRLPRLNLELSSTFTSGGSILEPNSCRG